MQPVLDPLASVCPKPDSGGPVYLALAGLQVSCTLGALAMTSLPQSTERPWRRRFELAYAIFTAIGLAFALVSWRGWLGVSADPSLKRTVFLSAYLALMATGWVTARRFQALSIVLLGAAVVAFILVVSTMLAG